MTNVPQTAFSLLYNATSVSPYRREAHEDLHVSFERFGITDGAIREACARMENAAYELRVASVDPSGKVPSNSANQRYRTARVELDAATDTLFEILVKDFTWFLTSYGRLAAGSDQYKTAGIVGKPSDARLLLEVVYHCFYVQGFAGKVVAEADQLRQGGLDGPVLQALLFVAVALDSPEPLPVEQAQEHAKVLCAALAREYKDAGWSFCW